MKKKKTVHRSLYILSLCSVVVATIALISVTVSWLYNTREIDTVTWIKTPITLDIHSGNKHDIAYLDMGEIDVEGENNYIDYVFSVYGEPIDIYSLQIAYTTNIAFFYDVYRAQAGEKAGNTTVEFSFNDGTGEKTEVFSFAETDNVISAKPLYKMTDAEIEDHQSHSLSYTYNDESGVTPVSKVHSNAEPLYWLANENGLNVMNPRNKSTSASGNPNFCDYYVIRVSWEEGKVTNNKETDMVYLTVSR